MQVIRQNLCWATVYNVAAIPAAAFGLLNPWLSGVGMAISSAVVVLNALRLRKGRDGSSYLLIPLSVALVFAALWIFFRASDDGQFDDLVGPALRVVRTTTPRSQVIRKILIHIKDF
jgi:cbb3-type cytochrome oxidase maturation protein